MDNDIFPGNEQNKAPDKKGFSLFKKKDEHQKGPDINEIVYQLNIIERRLRVLEERFTDLSRQMQVIEKNMLNERKIITKEIKVINSDILDIKRDSNSDKSKIDMIISELKSFARKDEIEVLRKYVELWEPVNFVTRNEIEKIIHEKLREQNE